jgi:hypothetical protein
MNAAIDFTKFDEAMALLSEENDKLAESVQRVELIAPEVPVSCNGSYKCKWCENYFHCHQVWEDTDGFHHCHECNPKDCSDHDYERQRDKEDYDLEDFDFEEVERE